MKGAAKRTPIFVSLDVGEPALCGTLCSDASRGKELFSFEYDPAWLAGEMVFVLDPGLQLYRGPQYAEAMNFGIFLDSSPDRWGRLLMRRREALRAREEHRPLRTLRETDYLLGVHDTYRGGALRFQTEKGGPYLDADRHLAAPPWTSLRELQEACFEIEKDNADEHRDYAKWLRMLVAPGGSLGGARPKASVVDEKGALWLAKFPGRTDTHDVGAWEMVAHELGRRCGLRLPEARAERFSSTHHTFLVKRFDRDHEGKRLFFMSAMTALARADGDDASQGASYLEIAEALQRFGAAPTEDLRELWSRMVFSVLVSNTDDHLRNHGFLIDEAGWRLSPAYDMNPNPEGEGLTLAISEDDNSQDLDLLLAVAKHFRWKAKEAQERLREMRAVVMGWPTAAEGLGVSRGERTGMARAFRLAVE